MALAWVIARSEPMTEATEGLGQGGAADRGGVDLVAVHRELRGTGALAGGGRGGSARDLTAGADVGVDVAEARDDARRQEGGGVNAHRAPGHVRHGARGI